MKKILVYSMFFVSLTFLVLIPGNKKALAAATLTASETVANVEEVEEVKAARTLTVAGAIASSTAGTTASQLTIGTCLVTFATTTSGHAYVGAADLTADELDCADDSATILLATTSNDTALSVALLAQELRGLTNVSDTGHGALTIGGSNATVSFTTTGTEAAATNITFSTTTNNAISNSVQSNTPTTGVVPVSPVAQSVTFTPTLGQRYTYAVTINANSYNYEYLKGSLQSLVEEINRLVTADSAVDCTENDEVVTCTSSVAGTSFTYNTTVTAPTEEVVNFSSGRSSRGGGRINVINPPTATQIVVVTERGMTASQVESIKNQINSLFQLVQRLQRKLWMMRGF